MIIYMTVENIDKNDILEIYHRISENEQELTDILTVIDEENNTIPWSELDVQLVEKLEWKPDESGMYEFNISGYKKEIEVSQNLINKTLYHWDLTEGEGDIVYDSIQGRELILNNANWISDERFVGNTGLEFSGDGYIESKSKIKDNEDFWFKKHAIGISAESKWSEDYDSDIISQHPDADDRFISVQLNRNSEGSLSVYYGSFGDGGRIRYVTDGNAVTDDSLHRIILNSDAHNSSMNFFVDTEDKNTSEDEDNFGSRTYDVGLWRPIDKPFVGKVNTLTIFEDTLDVGEIDEDYNYHK